MMSDNFYESGTAQTTELLDGLIKNKNHEDLEVFLEENFRRLSVTDVSAMLDAALALESRADILDAADIEERNKIFASLARSRESVDGHITNLLYWTTFSGLESLDKTKFLLRHGCDPLVGTVHEEVSFIENALFSLSRSGLDHGRREICLSLLNSLTIAQAEALNVATDTFSLQSQEEFDYMLTADGIEGGLAVAVPVAGTILVQRLKARREQVAAAREADRLAQERAANPRSWPVALVITAYEWVSAKAANAYHFVRNGIFSAWDWVRATRNSESVVPEDPVVTVMRTEPVTRAGQAAILRAQKTTLVPTLVPTVVAEVTVGWWTRQWRRWIQPHAVPAIPPITTHNAPPPPAARAEDATASVSKAASLPLGRVEDAPSPTLTNPVEDTSSSTGASLPLGRVEDAPSPTLTNPVEDTSSLRSNKPGTGE